jgi:hypothetical protein
VREAFVHDRDVNLNPPVTTENRIRGKLGAEGQLVIDLAAVSRAA